MRNLLVGALASTLLAVPAMAQTFVKDGAEFVVNTTTFSAQWEASVAALSGGGFVVAWTDFSTTGLDTSSTAVRAQRYDAAGVAAGAEFLVNTITNSTQNESSVTGLSGGGFVIAWTDNSRTVGDTSGHAIRAQRYDAAGVVAGGEFLVNTTITLAQSQPSVSALDGGGFVIAWRDASTTAPDTSADAIRAQRYDAAGAVAGGEFLVNTTTTNTQYDPSVSALDGGGFVIAWSDASATAPDTSPAAIRAQRYDAAGAVAGGEFLVNTTTTNTQYGPSVSTLDGGGFVIAWSDASTTAPDVSAEAIRAQRYDAAGAVAGGEFLVNTTTTNAQYEPRAAALPDGDLIIVWTDLSLAAPDTDSNAVRAQRFATFTANSRVIDAFVTAASDFGGSGTDEIASAIDFDAIDVTGDLQFAVVVQNTGQFDGYSNVLLSIDLEGAVFDGYLTSSVFASGGSCAFSIQTGGLDGGSAASFVTADLSACDARVYDREYSAGTDDDDMVFTIPVRLTGGDVNFSVEIVRNGDTVIGSDVQDNDDGTTAIDPVAMGLDDALLVTTYGRATRAEENPLGEGASRLATLASDYNNLDSTYIGRFEGTADGLVYDGGSLVAADISTHVEEVELTFTIENASGLEGVRIDDCGDFLDAAFDDQNQAVFTITSSTDVTPANVENGIYVYVLTDADPDTAIANTGLTTSIVSRFLSGLGLADTTGTGGIDQISREGSNTVTFEWVGDATKSTVNVFRFTGLGDELPAIRVTLSNSNTGVDGEYVLVPTAALNNGELIVTAANLQTAVGSAFGRADVTFSIEASGVTVRRLMMTNGVVSENSADLIP